MAINNQMLTRPMLLELVPDTGMEETVTIPTKSNTPKINGASQFFQSMRVGLNKPRITVKKYTQGENPSKGEHAAALLASPVIVVTEALGAVTGVLQVIYGVVGGVGVGVTNRSWSKFIDFASANISEGSKATIGSLLNVVPYVINTVILAGIIFLGLVFAAMLV